MFIQTQTAVNYFLLLLLLLEYGPGHTGHDLVENVGAPGAGKVQALLDGLCGAGGRTLTLPRGPPQRLGGLVTAGRGRPGVTREEASHVGSLLHFLFRPESRQKKNYMKYRHI